MKPFLWLLLLGGIVYVMYSRATVYGLPWNEQVVITNYDAIERYSGGRLYVNGEVRNRTRKPVRALIECTAVPPGMTITPKASTSVDLQAEEAFPFSMEINSRPNTTGAECKVRDWNAGGGLEEKLIRSAQQTFRRVRGWF